MLQLKQYSRRELISIFKTDRIDSIKKLIIRQGYIYNDCGRGDKYTLTVVQLPPLKQQLKLYCIEELKFKPQIEIDKLCPFLYNVLTNDSFRKLQLNEMKEELEKQGVAISINTLSNYYQHLLSIGWIEKDYHDFIYYVFDSNINHNRYITKEEYCIMYKQYWNKVREDKSFVNAEIEIREKFGNKPKKRVNVVTTAFCNDQYNIVLNYLEEIYNGN